LGYGRFFLVLIFSAVGFFGIFAGINYVIDPYGIYHLEYPLWLGIGNKPSAEQGSYSRMIRPYRFRFYNPDLIFFGSSRAEIGLDPLSADLGGRSAFNFGQGKMEWEENLELTKYASDHRPQAHLIYGVDFAMLNRSIPINPSFRKERLSATLGAFVGSGDMLQSLLSFTTFQLSSNLAALDHSSYCRFYRCLYARGRNIVNIWAQNIYEIRKELRHFMLQSRTFDADYMVLDHSNPKYAAFVELVRFLYQSSHKATFFLSPSHAEQVEAIRAYGSYGHYEDWKRAMVSILEAQARRYKKNTIALWDFQGYNGITTIIPDRKDISTLGYHLESSHYTKKTGDMVLRRVLGVRQGELPNDFGVLLTKDNIEEHLQQQRLSQQEYHKKLKALKIRKLR